MRRMSAANMADAPVETPTQLAETPTQLAERRMAEMSAEKTTEYPLGYSAFFPGRDKSANIALCASLCTAQSAAHKTDFSGVMADDPKFGHPEGVLIRPVSSKYELWVIHTPPNMPAIAMEWEIMERTRVATMSIAEGRAVFQELSARGLTFAYAYQLYMASDSEFAAESLEREKSGYSEWAGTNYRDLDPGEWATLTHSAAKSAQI